MTRSPSDSLEQATRLERLKSYFCSDPYEPDDTFSVGTIWVAKEHRFVGRFHTYYNGNRVSWGFWFFSVEFTRSAKSW